MHTVFELRRYRLRPGGREALIGLFDNEFIEPQEALGMRVEGEFRDLDDPDAFVWVRSFADMEARTEALKSFYSSAIWKKHGPAANETMLNSDNVLLLKPVGGVMPFSHNRARKEEVEQQEAEGLVIATICSLAPGTEDEFAALFIQEALPVLQDAGARVDAVLVTERSTNGFPRLPVREGETVLVWFECHKDEAGLARYRERLGQNAKWTEEVYPRMDGQCWRRIEVARLTPTPRSLCTW
ncbi:NIPSNAP family protein [Sinorhizobium terangae]|uniref:NIPSNAP family protein n=2 Tax=Sinorhizobium terangae TaxID=110322 RepID=A0A6N7LMI2_SINTE|nr:NIPSNAP family protein [Sinorhizobium terangae]MQX19042.1 NIPSNAP family protein [Sinorhizobium terangae]